ncbi:MAG TPA: LamG-like jellyroll fold domain-containing protein [Puia sp.]|nr:LamG-like jellyroll fold domain-containing protein [Puia sp.]
MRVTNKIAQAGLLILGISLGIAACQKMVRPALGNYPKDSNPPGGPLKFYAALDGGDVDSIRAVFGTDVGVTYVDGAAGKSMQADATGHIVYPSANDWKNSTSFTVAFWINKAGPNTAGLGTAFAFGVGTSKTIWTYQDVFLEFEDAGNPSTTDSAACKFYLLDQWFEFIKVPASGATPAVDKRLPKLLNGQWHHLAFSFDQTTATLTTYIDGAAYTNLPAGFGKFTGGTVDLSKIGGFVVGGPGMFALGKTPADIGQTWMGNFNGKIDQFRLYGTALSAADVSALYSQKK